MKNNRYIDICAETLDEQFAKPNMTERLKEYHNDKLNSFGLQHWEGFRCPLCKAPMNLIGLRSIEVRLHAKDFGDAVVEMLCQNCKGINRLHFPRITKNVGDFISFLSNTRPHDLNMITERELLSQKYNNLLDEMMTEGKQI